MTTADLNDRQVVHYKTGYRHLLAEPYEQYVAGAGIFPIYPGGNEFVQLTLDGRLIIRRWYAWDGASGPAFNDKAFVRPSLVHDAGCQLWELGVIDKAGRAAFDKLLGQMLRHDMQVIADRLPWAPRVVYGVSWYTEHVARRRPDEILIAP